MVEWMRTHIPAGQAVATLVLLVLVLFVRIAVVHRLRRSETISSELRRRSIVQVRNGSIVGLLVGLLIIWASQIQVIAISVVAIAAAIVIATKELIMCLTGTLVRLTGQSFTVGDRIEISTTRGDVIDQTLLTTTVLEVGPGQLTHQHTGRAVVLPNSIFLTAPVINETFTDEFVLHVFIVPIKTSENWKAARDHLLRAAQHQCQPFLEQARAHMEALGQEQGLYTPSVEPRVTMRFPEPGRVDLVVRIPVPARRKGRIEQAILNVFVDNFAPGAGDASRTDVPPPTAGA